MRVLIELFDEESVEYLKNKLDQNTITYDIKINEDNNGFERHVVSVNECDFDKSVKILDQCDSEAREAEAKEKKDQGEESNQCPNCGSYDVRVELHEISEDQAMLVKQIYVYKCQSCNQSYKCHD